MVNRKLVEYLNLRFDENRHIDEIVSELRNEEGFDENEFHEAIEEVIKEKTQLADEKNIQKKAYFMYLLLVGGILVLILSFSPLNPRGKSFPQLVGFLMIFASIVLHMGTDKVKIMMQKVKEMQEEAKKKM